MTAKLYIVVCVILLITVSNAVNRDVCASEIRNEINNGSLNAHDSTFFYDVPASLDPKIPLSLRLESCLSKCGGFTWYTNNEISNRIVGWLIPVLLLIGNMHMPPLSGKYKAFSILHFIGDPIDSMLSLQHTLSIRHAAYKWAGKELARCHLAGKVAPQDLATVFWAFDTLNAESSKSPIDILVPLLDLPDFPFAVSEAAADIRNTTVKESARTYLAILTYLGTIISAFVKASSSADQCVTRPGNRIALAMLYCWLLPAILLSTFAARFTTSDACVRAIKRFTRHLRQPELTDNSLLPTEFHSRLFSMSTETHSVQAASPWSGAIYVYRPRKPLFSPSLPYYPSPAYMLLLSIIPIVIAMCIAIAISYNTPTVGFGCRSIAEITISCMWLLSFFITLLLHKLCLITGKFHLLIVGVKDFLVGVGALMAIAIIYAGAFNSCWCWSNGVNGILGHSLHVLLSVGASLQTNAETVYPGLVGGGLGAQVAVLLLMWGGGWGDRNWSEWASRFKLRLKGIYASIKTSAGSESGIPLMGGESASRSVER